MRQSLAVRSCVPFVMSRYLQYANALAMACDAHMSCTTCQVSNIGYNGSGNYLYPQLGCCAGANDLHPVHGSTRMVRTALAENRTERTSLGDTMLQRSTACCTTARRVATQYNALERPVCRGRMPARQCRRESVAIQCRFREWRRGTRSIALCCPVRHSYSNPPAPCMISSCHLVLREGLLRGEATTCLASWCSYHEPRASCGVIVCRSNESHTCLPCQC